MKAKRAAEIAKRSREIIEARVRPAVARDGGGTSHSIRGRRNRIVRLNMRGSWRGLPVLGADAEAGQSKTMLRHYVFPEVNGRRASR